MTHRAGTVAPNFAERLERRRKQIELVMRLDFPESWAPPPPSTLHEDAAARAKKELHLEWWKQQEAARDARREELRKMTDKQLAAVCAQRMAEWSKRDRIRRKKQTPRAHRPEAQYWAHPAELEFELIDGALLLVKIEPRKGLGLHLKKMLSGEYADDRYVREDRTPEGLSDEARAKLKIVQDVMRRARMAERNGLLKIARYRPSSGLVCEMVKRCAFLKWAAGNGYKLPEVLAPLVDKETREQEPATETKERPPKKAKRRDSIWPVIDKAALGTNGSVESVWPRLRQLAEAKEPPFTGKVEGSALCYINDKNEPDKFARGDLRKRLERLKSPAAKDR